MPNREHVFHVKFPDFWTQGDLNNHFRKFGPVGTRWIDSSSAFVSLIHRENAPIVLSTIEKNKNVQVASFAAYSTANKIEYDEVSIVVIVVVSAIIVFQNSENETNV